MKTQKLIFLEKIVCFGNLIHVLSWRQHQCLCFHYWDVLTNFWRNNSWSIFDVVDRLCTLSHVNPSSWRPPVSFGYSQVEKAQCGRGGSIKGGSGAAAPAGGVRGEALFSAPQAKKKLGQKSAVLLNFECFFEWVSHACQVKNWGNWHPYLATPACYLTLLSQGCHQVLDNC